MRGPFVPSEAYAARILLKVRIIQSPVFEGVSYHILLLRAVSVRTASPEGPPPTRCFPLFGIHKGGMIRTRPQVVCYGR